MSDSNTSEPNYNGAGDLEKGRNDHLERAITPGGHPADFSQPGIPQQHRKYGNPVPLGLISFGCGFFLASAFNVHTRGVRTPNVMVPVLILYGGITQSLCGWWEMFLGNTYTATIFASYGAFNLTFGALYLPAFGIIDAYTLADGTLSGQFSQAVGIYLMAWMMVTILFILASFRTSAAVLSTLIFTALAFLTLGIYQFTAMDSARIAGGAFGFLATACAWWAAMAGYWTRDTTFAFVHINPVDMSRHE